MYILKNLYDYWYYTMKNKTFNEYGPVAQRITRLTTDQKIPGSNPGRIDDFFFI